MFIHNPLLFSNPIVWRFKVARVNSSSPKASEDRILSQASVRNTLTGDLLLDTTETKSSTSSGSLSSNNSMNNEIMKEYVNFCKLLHFLGVKSKEEIFKVFEFIGKAEKKNNGI